jgi:uncharacterized phage infection (PIP) family protein YhgE
MLSAVDALIDGFNFIGLALGHVKAKFDNFISFMYGKPTQSLMDFDDLVAGMRFSNLADGIDFIVDGFSQFNAEIKASGQEAANMAADAAKLQKEVEDLTAGLMNGEEGLSGLTDKTTKAKDALKKLKDAAKDAAQTIVDNLEESLRSAESKLDDARSAFTSFKNGIMDSVKGIVNFGKAVEEGDFFKNLTDQAASATNFATKVQKLIALGLSERGIQQVLDAGFEAGTKIADEIIAGGATMVQQINTLVSAVDIVAEQVGSYGADVFYGEGVRQGESLVAGIRAALLAAQAELKAIVDSLGSGEVKPATAGEAPKTPKTKIQPKTSLVPSSLTKSNAQIVQQLAAQSAMQRNFAAAFGPKKFAKGGIVMGATNAIIGEAGPEAVIPLNKANGMGNTYNLTINAGIGTDGNAVGRQIVDAIKRFEKTSGPVFASA